MTGKQMILLGVVIALVAVGIWQYAGTGQEETTTEEKSKIIDPEENLAAAFSSVHVVGRKEGRKQYDFTFDVVEQVEDKVSFAVFSNLVDGKIYGTDGDLQYRVDAGWGKWYESSENLELQQGVELSTADGQVLTGPAFVWRAAEDTIESKGRVDVQTPSAQVQADHIVVDLATDEAVLTDNIIVSDDLGSILTGSKAVYRSKEEILEVMGPAEIEVIIGGARNETKLAKSSQG